MHSFLNLVGFEYKKIFQRKSAIITLILVLLIVCTSPLDIFIGMSYIDGQPFESHYQAMVKDRDYARALSGRLADETLFAETRDAYAKIPPAERYSATPEYQQYARPYHEIFWLLRIVYDDDLEGVQRLTKDDFKNFYRLRHEWVSKEIRASRISGAAKDELIRLDSEIEMPFNYGFTDGYNTIFVTIYILGIACAFTMAICFAPMFAGEYSTRADQLILSSKLGKNKLISAKLFTAVSLSIIYFIVLALISVAVGVIVYGFDGARTPLQLLWPFLAYPITMIEAALIIILCTLMGTLLTVAVTLLLSSLFKSPFGVIIIISVMTLVPMMFHVPESLVRLYNAYSLLPINMMTEQYIFSHVPFDFGGLVVLPYVFMPIFTIFASAVMLLFARRGFRNHQIG
jgi:hypothetical protein